MLKSVELHLYVCAGLVLAHSWPSLDIEHLRASFARAADEKIPLALEAGASKPAGEYVDVAYPVYYTRASLTTSVCCGRCGNPLHLKRLSRSLGVVFLFVV